MVIEARIAGLFVYPVKGCAGLSLEAAELTPRGLAHDRRWMIVDPAGRFLTQRELPRLATIRPGLAGGTLRLDLDGAATLAVPVEDRGDPMAVQVWGDEVAALAVGSEVDEALSSWLGRTVRLARFPEAARRPCDPDYAPAGSHTGFADGFPLLVTSESSLLELNQALVVAGGEPVPMSRFRPNLVLSDIGPGTEDRCRRLRLPDGGHLELVKRCDRCVVTTIDQATGTKTGKEPLATLARLRRNVRTGGAWFGQNAVPALAGPAPTLLRLGDVCLLDA